MLDYNICVIGRYPNTLQTTDYLFTQKTICNKQDLFIKLRLLKPVLYTNYSLLWFVYEII